MFSNNFNQFFYEKKILNFGNINSKYIIFFIRIYFIFSSIVSINDTINIDTVQIFCLLKYFCSYNILRTTATRYNMKLRIKLCIELCIKAIFFSFHKKNRLATAQNFQKKSFRQLAICQLFKLPSYSIIRFYPYFISLAMQGSKFSIMGNIYKKTVRTNLLQSFPKTTHY